MLSSTQTSEKDKNNSVGRETEAGRFVAVWVKQDDKWKLASLIELATPIPNAVAALNEGKLAQLDHLVGRWKGASDKLTLQISAGWNLNRTFLSRRFSVLDAGKEIFGGTQIIGWDPASQSIKSWSFNSDGGRAEGTWDLDGPSWVVVTTGVNARGLPMSNTQFFKFRTPDSLEWKCMQTQLGCTTFPDVTISLKRESDAK